MEEQQQTGMATPSDQPSTATPSTNAAPAAPRKLNRKQRRVMHSFDKKQARLSNITQHQRLSEFHTLTSWKDKEVLRKNRMTDDQIASVFRVALGRLFKSKEIIRKREKVSFASQLEAIVRNVKQGFKYKSDVAPQPAAPAQEAAAPTEG